MYYLHHHDVKVLLGGLSFARDMLFHAFSARGCLIGLLLRETRKRASAAPPKEQRLIQMAQCSRRANFAQKLLALVTFVSTLLYARRENDKMIKKMRRATAADPVKE